MQIRVKRVYAKPDPIDGFRILVDRLWPRGIKKRDERVTVWAKNIAPSNELRKWFAHDIKKWPEFKSRYKKELNKSSILTARILNSVNGSNLTLLYSSKDEKHNNAVVLAEFLKNFNKKVI